MEFRNNNHRLFKSGSEMVHVMFEIVKDQRFRQGFLACAVSLGAIDNEECLELTNRYIKER